ncbi:MAG: type II toxin-antitoxin system PemK/MazF family toxin [Cyanobacteria bacterium P01_E01_bin.34]
MPTFKQFDVVVVPFPFTDRTASKRRPALVLSDESAFNSAIGHSLLAMITTATHSSWPLDNSLQDLSSAGLKVPSIVRMKLFTLDHALILKTIGQLSKTDRTSVKSALKQLLGPSE